MKKFKIFNSFKIEKNNILTFFLFIIFQYLIKIKYYKNKLCNTYYYLVLFNFKFYLELSRKTNTIKYWIQKG